VIVKRILRMYGYAPDKQERAISPLSSDGERIRVLGVRGQRRIGSLLHPGR
jgi:hypothetical protein